MFTIQLPDGTEVSLPADMPPEQIRDLIASKFPNASTSSPADPTITVGGRTMSGADYMALPDEERQLIRNEIAQRNPETWERPWWANRNTIGDSIWQMSKYGADAEEYEPSMVPILDSIGAFGNQLAANAPFGGPILKDWGEKVDAGFASLVEGKPVTAEEREAINKADAERFPLHAAAGGLTGQIAPLAVLGATQLGARALGMAGPLWQRALLGAASGATISGADALARGKTPREALIEGLWGVGTGAALPYAEHVISPVVRALLGKNIPASVRSIGQNAARDRIDPATILAQLDAIGPDAMLLDLGPNLTRQAGAIASLPGEGQTILRSRLADRHDGSPARIRREADEIFGPATTPRMFTDDITAQQEALRPQYEKLLEGASWVDTAPVALRLESAAVNLRGEAQSTARTLRNMLNITGGNELDPYPGTLLQIRDQIDLFLKEVKDGEARNLLRDTRRQVNDILVGAVPGIRQVDAQAATLAQQRQAFEDGMAALDSGLTDLRPTDLRDMLEGTPAEVLSALSQGTRAEIDRLIGTKAGNIEELKDALLDGGSWNRERLGEIFGPEQAQPLVDLLERELTYNRHYNQVFRDTDQAAIAAAQKAIAPTNVEFGATAEGALLKLLERAVNAGVRTRSQAVSSGIAELLSGRPTQEMIDLMTAVQKQAQRGNLPPAVAGLVTDWPGEPPNPTDAAETIDVVREVPIFP